MSTFNGLPAHILLNHFIVVLGPLTAILAILCALWPAARRRLIWLVVLLAVGTLVLTPLTTTAGVWLSARVGPATPVLTNHEQLGSTLIWVIAALVAAVAVLGRRPRSSGARGRRDDHPAGGGRGAGHRRRGGHPGADLPGRRLGCTRRMGERDVVRPVSRRQAGRPNCSTTARRSSDPFAVCGNSPASEKLVGIS